jgi:hypothetical protein
MEFIGDATKGALAFLDLSYLLLFPMLPFPIIISLAFGALAPRPIVHVANESLTVPTLCACWFTAHMTNHCQSSKVQQLDKGSAVRKG